MHIGNGLITALDRADGNSMIEVIYFMRRGTGPFKTAELVGHNIIPILTYLATSFDFMFDVPTNKARLNARDIAGCDAFLDSHAYRYVQVH